MTMTNKHYLASLLCLVATSATAQARRIQLVPVFEIETVAAETHAKLTVQHIWANGAWTVEDFRAKTPRSTSGRVTDDQLKALRAELATAPWQHQYAKSPPPCARPTIETHYLVDGKLVLSEPACGDKLDDQSLRALAYAKGFTVGVLGVPGAAPAPDCEIAGAPMIELADNTTRLAVYKTGAVTNNPNNGSKRATTKQCIAPDAVARIASDLSAATWKQTPVMHCMMAATDQTTITVGGKVVFVERVCNPFKLDDQSAKSLADIEQVLGWSPAGTTTPPPPPPDCEASGAPLIELANNATKVVVYKTGAITNSPNNGSKRATTKQCVAQDVVARITADLAAATWKQTQVVHCMIAATDQTTVTIGGRVVFVEQVCNPVKLDDASAKSLADIEQLVGWAPAGTKPPPPPDCEVSGAPLIELADNATRIAVYKAGAVTNNPNNGSKRATTKQCIAQDVVDKIAAALAAAPWKQTPVMHCMIAATDQTTVTVGGRVVFVERVCNPNKLDDASVRSLAEIEKLLGWVQPGSNPTK